MSKLASLGSCEQTCLFCFAWLWFVLASVFAALGTRARRARMVDEAARFAEWTKEGRGGMPPPEEPLAKELLELFKSGDIVVSSIVTSATVIPKDDLRELWSAVWTDVDVIRQAAGDKAMPSSRRQRYVLWSLLPTVLFDVTRDNPASRSADKKRTPDVVNRHHPKYDESDDEAEEAMPVSSRQRKDMEDQAPRCNPPARPCMYVPECSRGPACGSERAQRYDLRVALVPG